MKSKVKDLVFLHTILLIYSLTGVLSKVASKKEFLSLEFIVLYGIMILVLTIYAILWQQIIKKMPIVTAYANKGITVIWGIIWGMLIFHEKITLYNIVGAGVIVVGIIVLISAEKEA